MRAHPVNFRERTLKTIPLNLLHSLPKNSCLKRRAISRCRGQDFSAIENFRLETGGLVQYVVTVHVVARHFKSQHVRAGLQPITQVPLVHPIESMRTPRGSVPEEFAVEKHPV